MGENVVKRNVDVVLCIDATGSMGGVIENVKENARRFYTELIDKLVSMGSEVDGVRVKVIAFRDYGCDAEPMKISEFFELPGDDSMFEDYLSTITAEGGGDSNENGLEAIYYALSSDWVTGAKDRQVTVLFSDADALPLLARKDAASYPADMVDEGGLINTWTCAVQKPGFKLQPRNKRMVLFAPEGTKYQDFANKLAGCIFKAVTADNGLKDVDFSEIINVIAASVSK
jgi:hypothetical protein